MDKIEVISVDFVEQLADVALKQGFRFRLSPFGIITTRLGLTVGTVGDDGVAIALYILR